MMGKRKFLIVAYILSATSGWQAFALIDGLLKKVMLKENDHKDYL